MAPSRTTNGSGYKANGDAGSDPSRSGNVIFLPGRQAAQFEGERTAARFRYHRESFQRSLIIAIGMTVLVCGLVWLLLGIYGTRYMNWITAVTGLVFFAFISARMLAQYLRDDVVLAVQPTGLYDGRISSQTIPWEDIKELVLVRREQDYTLRIVRWPRDGGEGRTDEIDLSGLERGTEPVLEAIQSYMPVRLEI